MIYYYDLHVFYSSRDGFSVPVKIETTKTLDDNDVIQHALITDLIDSEDAEHIDYVDDIDEDEYNNMLGIIKSRKNN